jgi:hypothetical protein
MVPSIIPLSVVEGRSRVAWLRTKASALPDAFLDAFFVFVFLDFPDAFFSVVSLYEHFTICYGSM